MLSHAERRVVQTATWIVRTLRVIIPGFGHPPLEAPDLLLIRNVAALGVQRRPTSRLYGDVRAGANEAARLRVCPNLPSLLENFVVLQRALRLIFPNTSRAAVNLAVLVALTDDEGGDTLEQLVMVDPAPFWFVEHLPELLRLRPFVRAGLPADAAISGVGAHCEDDLFPILLRGAQEVRDRGDFNAALVLLRACRAHAERDGADHQVARALLNRGIVRGLQGGEHRASAYRDFRAAARRARSSGDREVCAKALHELSGWHTLAGNVTLATRYARKAFGVYGADHDCLPRLIFDIGALWIKAGYYRRGREVFVAVLPLLQDDALVAAGSAWVALASAMMGDRDQSRAAMTVALRGSRDSAAWNRPPMLLKLGQAAAVLGDRDGGLQLLKRAVRAAKAIGDADVRGEGHRWISALRRGAVLPPVSPNTTSLVVDVFADEVVWVCRRRSALAA